MSINEQPPIIPSESAEESSPGVVIDAKELFRKRRGDPEPSDGELRSFHRRNLLVHAVEMQRSAHGRKDFSDEEVLQLIDIRKEYEREHQLRTLPTASKPQKPLGLDLEVFGETTRTLERIGAEFIALDVRGGNFVKATLRNSSVVATNFSGADLEHATFSGTDCRGCDFTNADLSHATVEGADFTGAILTGAKLPDGFEQMVKLSPPDSASVPMSQEKSF